jgi:hypothetical protein
VNEATIDVPSGRLSLGGVGDLSDTLRIDVDPGSYRVRVYYGNLTSLIKSAPNNEHYKLIMWRAAPAPVLVLKQPNTVREMAE